MAWEFFTTWLTADDQITLDMHRELYRAAVERFECAGVSPGRLSDYAEADLFTLRGAAAGQTLFQSLIGIASGASINQPPEFSGERPAGYLRVYDDPAAFGTGGDSLALVSIAADDLGVFIPDINSLTSAGLASFHAYNLARRMIQLLRFPLLRQVERDGREKLSVEEHGDGYGWGQHVDDYLPVAETAPTFTDFPAMFFQRQTISSADHILLGKRDAFNLIVPDKDPYDLYDYKCVLTDVRQIDGAWELQHVDNDQLTLSGIPGGTATIDLDAADLPSGARSNVVDTADRTFERTAQTTKGTLAVTGKIKSYDNETTLKDEYVARFAAGEVEFVGFLRVEMNYAFLAKPVFTHPYEAM